MTQASSRRRPTAALTLLDPSISVTPNKKIDSGDLPPWAVSDLSFLASSSDEDTECSPSKKKYNHGKQGQRSLSEQLRLWFLTGRIQQVAVRGTIAILIAVTCHQVMSYHMWGWQTYYEPVDPTSGLTIKPEMVGMYFHDVSTASFSGRVQRIPVPTTHQQWMKLLHNRLEKSWYRQDNPTGRHLIIPVEPMSDPERQTSIEEGSEDYEEEKPWFSPNPDECKPQYAWQTQSYPTCNSIHERTMMSDRMYLRPLGSEENAAQRYADALRRNLVEVSRSTPRATSPDDGGQLLQKYRLLGHGYWRDTWMFRNPTELDDEVVAFKTTKYEHYLSEYLLDKQRRDSVTSDRLQFSNHAIHMYAHCGTSSMYEWAPGGDMESFIERFGTPQQFVDQFPLEERFKLAYNVTAALNDLHNTEGSNRPAAIVHADFRADQFVSVTPLDLQNSLRRQHKLPEFKLGDFNLARFPYWNIKYNHPCHVETEGDGGEFRAPEEYSGEVRTTEKLDIYSLGNLLYTLLNGHWPFDDMEGADDDGGTSKMKKLVQSGRRPHINIDADYTNDKDPHVQTLLKAIQWCWEQDPHKRPSAQQVEDLLADHLPPGMPRLPRRR